MSSIHEGNNADTEELYCHMKSTLLLSVLCLLSGSVFPAFGGFGVRQPWLISGDPFVFYDESIPRLYSVPRLSTSLAPSILNGFLSWRLYYSDIPVSNSRTAYSSDLYDAILSWSSREAWFSCNRNNCIRSAREHGSLLPTIYLPLNMPPILASTIGEGGQLDISGHQKIMLSGISHIRPNQVSTEGQTPSFFPDLKMEQELQVHLEGTIGEKIHVDVDHDSQRSLGPQNSISISYDGYDDEIIQSIEVGDVNLSITGPEFVSYSIPHQGLFGAKILAQVGPVEITTIASKEASSTETADFVGQATAVTDTILDVYPANNYFFLTYPDTVAQPEIVSIRIFQDDLDATNNAEMGAVEGSWAVPISPGDTLSGNGFWDELLAGPDQDFVLVDSVVIRFFSPVNDNYMLAIWMVTASGDTIGSAPAGGPYELKLIKNSNPLATDPTWNYELRNHYYLGANNIVKESFEADIFLERSGQDPISTQDGVPFIAVLGLDTNGDGSLVDEDSAVDWENGFLVFPDIRPFTSSVLDVQNPKVYNTRYPQSTDSKYFIRVSYRAASTTYSLGHIGIIPGSERVTLTVAGQQRTLVRDQDYTIIYEIGLLTLIGEAAEQAQDPANRLRVTYEYVPFFASQQKTLVGTRAVYELGRYSWIGATMMYENASSPDDRPRVGEEASYTIVTDVDVHFEARPDFLTEITNSIPGINTDAESRVVLSGEVAVSMPGAGDRVYVDDMEGAESSFPLGQARTMWFYSSMPRHASSWLFPNGDLAWFNPYNKWRVRDIIPGEEGSHSYDYVNSVLEFVFEPDNDNYSSWGGVQRCLDRYGMDLSKKTRIRLYIRTSGSAANASIYLDLGERISEDTYWLERVGGELVRRANGELDTEDLVGDGILGNDEDTGLDNLFDEEEPGYSSSSNPDPNQDDYNYNPEDPLSTRYNWINGTEGNGRLDTEDINRNGTLDTTSTSFFRIRIPIDDPQYIVSGPNEHGWMLIEIPLSDTTLVTVPHYVVGEPTWEKISYARLWMDSFTQSDTVEIYDLSIIGNRWENIGVCRADSIVPPIMPGEDFLISTVNNRENPDYAANPPPTVDPGKDDNGDPRLEQSLLIESVDIMGGHEGVARQTFYSAEDYTSFRNLRFLVHGAETAPGEAFYRIGRDSLNYYEINVPIEHGWQIISIDLLDLVDLKKLKNSSELDYLRAGNLAVKGNPNLADVMSLSLGLRPTGSQDLNTVVWVDDITLHDPYTDTGLAHRITAGIDFADFLSLSGDYRRVDADFHGLGSRAGTGKTVTRLTTGATMNLDRFSPPVWFWSMPVTFAWTRQVSEPRFQSNSDVRVYGEESWQDRTQTDSWNTSIQWRRNTRSDGFWGRYFADPVRLRHTFGLTTGRAPNSRDTLKTIKYEFSYDLTPGIMRLVRLPLLEDVRLRPTRIGFSVTRNNGWDSRWDYTSGDTVQTRGTENRGLSLTGSASFAFWKGQSSSYSLSVLRDMLFPWEDRLIPFNIGREISRNQNASVSQDINFFDYLRPRLSYDVNYSTSRLAPHTTGDDSLGRPDVSLTTTRRLTLRVGLVHAIRSVARLRDERLDEEAEPGSPRWLLMKLERFSNILTDPTVTISRTEGTSYKNVSYLPGYRYQFGLDLLMEGEDPWDRTKSDNLQISSGIRPVSTMSIRVEYSRTDTRHFYSGYWNRQESMTWPSVSFSWSGLERLGPFRELLRSGSVSSGYRFETSTSSRFEEDEYIPTSETQTTRWSPLVSISGTLKNKVQISVSDNLSITETLNFTGTMARTRSSNHSTQFSLSYAFSSPGGFAIPLPLLNKLRISFQSDLTTSLSITRSRNVSEVITSTAGTQVQSDREEWRIEPAANYDFGSVIAGLTGIYGWKTDRVNSLYDQRDVGLNIWVTINF